MIDLYYWPTPNGFKITIMLEECGLPYRLVPVNIGRGDQFKPDFLAISPNNRMPAIVDHEPGDGRPFSLFESGPILTYLAEKSGKLMPQDLRGRYEVQAWVAWQIANLGPMAGQASHFLNYAQEKIPYAIDRYTKEVNRLAGVLDRRLADREFIAGDYSIADIASYPWLAGVRKFAGLETFPHVSRWMATLDARPAVQRGMAAGAELRQGGLDDEARKALFGQTAASVASAAKANEG